MTKPDKDVPDKEEPATDPTQETPVISGGPDLNAAELAEDDRKREGHEDAGKEGS